MRAEVPPRTLRPPPRLRVKTGCQTCLKRRKKCPENRPVCSTCERLHYECVYNEPAPTAPPDAVRPSPNVVHTTEETTIKSPPLCSSLSIRPKGLRTERDWNVFNYCSTTYMKMITSPEAVSRYRDLSFVFAIGFDKPWVMDAVLAPAALHASFSSLIPKEDAVLYAQRALRGLRQSLVPEKPATFRRDPCLATSIYLAAFEGGLTHYQAVAHLLEAQFAKSSHLDLHSLSVLQLTLLDATLYHLSTRLILEKDVHAVWDAFPANTIAKYIDAREAEAKDTHNQPPILPVLGRTPPALFVQVLQITWLSRQLPFNDGEQQRLALQCLTELDRIQEHYQLVRLDDVASVSAEVQSAPRNSEISTKLYFLATHIFAAKVLDPDGVISSTPRIQALLRTAGKLLEMFDTAVPCGQFICWPLLILGCAACSMTFCEAAQHLPSDGDEHHRWKMRGLIHDMLVQIWSVSYSGYVQRTLGALEKIWNLPLILKSPSVIGYPLDTGADYDGLRALVHKDGLGAAFLLADES